MSGIHSLSSQMRVTTTSPDEVSSFYSFRITASRYKNPIAFSSHSSVRVQLRRAATKVYTQKENFSINCATKLSSNILLDTKDNDTEEKFNWFKNWWAVQVVNNLETDRPNKIQLLNKDFIVWKGHSGNWIAMDDECPHRMAPLSEGRIEKDGNLLCSYHAWRFNESGKCVKIPHAEDEKAHFVACNSSRSSVQTYPCKIIGSLLWIWPDNTINAFADSEKEPLPIDDDFLQYLEIDISDRMSSPYMRTLPYSYDVLMENIADPSHVFVSHHGVLPMLSRYNAKAMKMKQVDPISSKALDAVLYEIEPMYPMSHTEIRAPGLVMYYAKDAATESVSRSYFCITPIGQGKSLLIAEQASEEMISNLRRANFFQKPIYAMLRLFFHVNVLNKLFDTDIKFLYTQDRKIRRPGSQFSARKDYFIPTTADTLVMSFRNWFEKIGQYGAAFGGDKPLEPAAELSKMQLLNRYEQHTKNCKECMKALNTIRAAVFAFKTLFALSSFTLIVLLLKSSPESTVNSVSILKHLKLMIAGFISLLFFLLTNYLENKIIPLFYFVDHSHADTD